MGSGPFAIVALYWPSIAFDELLERLDFFPPEFICLPFRGVVLFWGLLLGGGMLFYKDAAHIPGGLHSHKIQSVARLHKIQSAYHRQSKVNRAQFTDPCRYRSKYPYFLLLSINGITTGVD